MKKYFSLTVLIISILMIVIGYIAYRQFIFPNFVDTNYQEEELTIIQSQIVELSALNEQENIYRLELELNGESSENLTVLICDKDTIPFNQISLKKGQIDHIYGSDWYSKECFLRISSKGLAKIKLKYRFLGLK